MPEMNDVNVEVRFTMNYLGKKCWYRMFMFGRTLPSFSDEDICLEIADYFTRLGNFWDKWLALFSITNYVDWLQIQIVYPHRSHVVDFQFAGALLYGERICGNQPPQATCRVKLHSSNWTIRSHWYQISPVPTFTDLLSPSRAQYLQLVENWTQFIRDGFTTFPGNTYRWAFRTSSGNFHVVDQTSVQLFVSTESRRTARN